MAGWQMPVVQARRLFDFSRRVLSDFRRNKGLLIAGALGYNALLSFIPLVALVAVLLAQVVDEDQLLQALYAEVEGTWPGRGETVTEAFRMFLAEREVVGTVGLAIMLFFSTIGFRMLEDAMTAIFRRGRSPAKRHPALAFIMPLAYAGLVGLGLVVLTLLLVAFDTLPEGALLGQVSAPLVKVLAFLGMVVLLASFYGVMPQARVRARLAFVGGLVAATLWEAVRSVMMWYFDNISLVDVVYGSLATVIVLVLSLEVAAMIVLLGAEVIAEIERSYDHGLPWYEAPPPE